MHDSARFPLSGVETKNLVPVDWVSAVMAHVYLHPEWHGRTYHLTPKHPVTARLLADTIEETIGLYSVKLEGAGRQLKGLTEYEALFADLIRVYASYWKDDPVFDSTNTRLAAPHLPCPHVDRPMLRMMARQAISINFTAPRDRPVTPRFDTPAWFETLLEADSHPAQPGARRIGLRVLGHGGGDWTLALAGSQPVSASFGLQARNLPLIEVNVETLRQLVEDGQPPEAGRLTSRGISPQEAGQLLLTLSKQLSSPVSSEK